MIVGTGANPENTLLPTVSTSPGPHYPDTMEQACKWIDQLREAYHREVAYRERLERKLSILRSAWDWARYWAHARGMHIMPYMRRLKSEVKLAEAALKEAGLETL